MEVAKKAYHQADLSTGNTDSENSPKEVGHNIYILAHQLAQHNMELAEILKTKQSSDEALMYYAKHTAQIEVGIGATSNYYIQYRYRYHS